MHDFFDFRDRLTFGDFSGFIDEARRRHKKSASARNMYHGDMWDHGRGYIGPVPIDNDSNSGIILRNIQRMFTSRNVIQEIVDRQVDALLSKSPDWKIFDKSKVLEDPTSVSVTKAPKPSSSPTVTRDSNENTSNEKVDPKIKEAEAILSEAWTIGGIGDALKKSVAERLLSGKGILRIYLSKTYANEKSTDLLDIAKYIKVEFVENYCGAVVNDDGNKLSVVQISTKKNKRRLIEISYVDTDGKTYVATLDKDSTGDIVSQAQANSEPLNNQYATSQDPESAISEIQDKIAAIGEISSPWSLQGNITADEILGRPFVSESMLQNNRALNLALSLGVGILVESGYAEMVVTNVSLETVEVDDPSSPNGRVTKPVGLKRGAGVINNLIGEQTIDAEGRTYFEKPSVYFKEPSKLVTFLEGEGLYYRQILTEAKQAHVLLNVLNDTSGEARIQSRQDFVKKSQEYKPSVDTHGSWVLNTVLNLVASAANKDNYFQDIKCIFDSKIYAGELSAAEQTIVISRYQNSLISRESAMVLLGTEDPLIEAELIKQDDADKLTKQVNQLEATSKFGNMVNNGQPATSEATKQKGENATKNVQTRTAKKPGQK